MTLTRGCVPTSISNPTSHIPHLLMPKKRFVLRVDEEAMKALERWAGDEFRSVNGQLEYLIMKALKEAGREPKRGKEKDA